ncbi:MAG: class I SAM-dependent methyltransferase [Planctomycetota bacterium]|nr:class I SAM-dependent methyltransferase [Planctomycetota bacterium]
MHVASAYYDRDYYSAVMRRLLDDEGYYQTKARCAAKLYFGSFPHPYGKILEYGCGIGQNLAALDQAVGYDASREALALCRQHRIETLAKEADIPPRHFHFVLCRHVLEHVEFPLTVLRRLFSFLRDDGLLILVLPKETHRHAALQPDLHRHLYCWNFRTINNLLFQAGGVPICNRYEPMFGPNTYGLLRPVLRLAGLSAYYHLGRWVGRLLGHTELVVHARPGREVRSDPSATP